MREKQSKAKDKPMRQKTPIRRYSERVYLNLLLSAIQFIIFKPIEEWDFPPLYLDTILKEQV